MPLNLKRIYHLSPRTLLVLGLGFSLLCGNMAYAQGKGTSGQESEVDKHYNAGVAIAESATKKDDWEKACNEFEQAFKLEPSPQIAANLGHAEYRAGHMRAAAEHLDYFLRKDKESTPEAKNEIAGFLKKATAHVVTVAVTVDQVGAEIVVNGVVKGVSPLPAPIFLEPGLVDITARKAGMRAEPQAYTFTKGDRADVTIKMVVDAPNDIFKESPSKTKSRTAVDRNRALLLASLGVSVLGIGIGAGFTAATTTQNSEVKAKYEERENELEDGQRMCVPNLEIDPQCSPLKDATTTRNNYVALSIAGYAVGLAGVAATLTIWKFTKKSHDADNHANVHLMVTPTGFAVKGTF